MCGKGAHASNALHPVCFTEHIITSIKEYIKNNQKSTNSKKILPIAKMRLGILSVERGMIMVDFGEKVRALREGRGLSQVQLAELLGVTKGIISAYETSVRMPSYKVLIRIARLFGVSTDYLLGLECREGIDTSGLNGRQRELVAELVNELRRTK